MIRKLVSRAILLGQDFQENQAKRIYADFLLCIRTFRETGRTEFSSEKSCNQIDLAKIGQFHFTVSSLI